MPTLLRHVVGQSFDDNRPDRAGESRLDWLVGHASPPIDTTEVDGNAGLMAMVQLITPAYRDHSRSEVCHCGTRC